MQKHSISLLCIHSLYVQTKKLIIMKNQLLNAKAGNSSYSPSGLFQADLRDLSHTLFSFLKPVHFENISIWRDTFVSSTEMKKSFHLLQITLCNSY